MLRANPIGSSFAVSARGLAAFLLLAGCEVRSDRFIPVAYPADAPRTTSDYLDEFAGLHRERRSVPHDGIDLHLPSGTPVLAAADGVVVSSSNDDCAGETIWIRHVYRGPGRAGGTPAPSSVQTVYTHLSKRLVNGGNPVDRGEAIGLVGNTGWACNTVSTHLHYGVHEDAIGSSASNHALNPHAFWYDGPGKIACFDGTGTYPEKAGTRSLFTYPVPCGD